MAYAVDFESYYDDEISITTMGGWHYARATDIYMVSIHGPKGTWVGRPEDFDWGAIVDEDWLSHNASFDTEVYEALKEKFPDLYWPTPPAWHCTSDMAAYMGSGRSLKEAAKVLLKVELSKDTRNKMKGKRWEDMTPEFQAEVAKYAIGDVVYCHQLWEKYGPLWPEDEKRLSLMTRQMGWRGVMTDMPKLESARKTLKQLLFAAESKIPWAGERDDKGKEIPLTSMKQIAERCRLENIECPKSMAEDDPELDIWLAEYGERYPWVQAVSEYRRLNTLYKKVETTIKRTRPTDGRMGYAIKYCGAHTFRWSGDGGWNAQNLPRDPIYVDNSDSVIRDPDLCDKIRQAIEERGGHESVKAVMDIRGSLIAPPGKKFGICDLSQIEPRVLWWMAGDTDALAMAATGMSPYEVHARVSMGWKGGKLKKENPRMYSLAKARVLALGYAAGWHKFYWMALSYGVSPTIFDDPVSEENRDAFVKYLTELPSKHQLKIYEAASEEMKLRYCNAWLIVCDFRRTNPKITALWKSMNLSFRQSVGGDYEVQLPSGRWMRYRRVRGPVYKVDRKEDEPDDSGFTAEVVKNGRFMRQRFYGGKLVENAVQATARDVFASATLRLIDAGYGIPTLTVHDENVMEIDENQSIKEIEEIMSVTPDWLPGCPIAAEGVESPCYKK